MTETHASDRAMHGYTGVWIKAILLFIEEEWSHIFKTTLNLKILDLLGLP